MAFKESFMRSRPITSMISARNFALIAVLLLTFSIGLCGEQKGGMQMTTKSQKARAFCQEGLAKMETLHIQAGLQNWRDAAKADPTFAWQKLDKVYRLHEQFRAAAREMIGSPRRSAPIISARAAGSPSSASPVAYWSVHHCSVQLSARPCWL